MLSVRDYEVTEVVAEGKTAQVVRARLNGRTFLLRRPAHEYPTPSDLARLKYGADIASSLDLSCVLKVLGTRRDGKSLVVIQEDHGGRTLRSLLKGGPLAVEQALGIAVQLSRALGELHRRRIVHKDLEPSNIFVDPASGHVKLAGFDIASRLDREMATPASPDRLEGNLTYISPEQTGRMSRAIDYRTDFYSLGVVLVEMLTGRPPFQARDPMALVHAHIAVEPRPTHELNPAVPLPLSRVVSRLLAKNAEDRYQSAYGLSADLLACEAMQKAGAIRDDFVPGAHDISAVFRLPQKLYGRDAERAALIGAFERASQGPLAVAVVAGYSGIGKSALVNELQRPVVERRGYFVSGKYDQLQNAPYGAIIQAFQDLVRQILTESEPVIMAWKGRLLEALGANGQVVVDVIPDVERIIGPQPPVAPLGPTESQNRFNILFQQFIGAVATADHPLAVFLDDLQWADTGSLNLIQLLAKNGAARHLLLVGSYRDNEAREAHPLRETLAELRKGSAALCEISLEPLTQADITALISDALSRRPDPDLHRLAALVFRKTEGNPFFASQFLSSLHAKEIIWFDAAAGEWAFTLERIHEVGLSADVAGLLAQRLKGLSDGAQRVLRLAACIGSNFDLQTLSVVCEMSPHDTAGLVWSAVELDLVRPVSAAYRYVDLDDALNVTLPPESVLFEFLHDRVQEAAYALISRDEPRAVHLRVGRLLLASTREEDREARSFDVANQLNLAIDLITDPEERRELARLNLVAGKRAKASNAYAPAVRYLKTGVELLPEDAWERHYELTFALYRHHAEAVYLLGDHEGAASLFERIQREARSRADRAETYRLEMSLQSSRGDYANCINAGLAALRIYGIDIPRTEALAEACVAAREKLEGILAGRSTAALADLPAVTDKDEQVRHLLLSQAVIYGSYTEPALFQIFSYTLVTRSIEHGHAAGSASGYVTYGMLVADHAAAYELGRVALAVSERFDDLHGRSLIKFMFGSFLNGWRRPVSEALPYIEQACSGCFESGAMVFAGIAAMQTVWMHLLSGDDLRSVRALASKNREFARRMNEVDMVNFIALFERTAALLTEGAIRPEEASFLEGDIIEERLAHFPPANLACHICALQASYLLGEHDRALAMAAKAERAIAALFGHIGGEPELRLYQALLFAELLPTAAADDRARYRDAIEVSVGKMEGWARSCPENFEHKHLVLSAELARLDGRYDEAGDLFDRAIDSAVQHEFTHVQAIACELAARLYLERGRKRVARAYLRDARHAFSRWGADAKIARMERRYGELLPSGAAEDGAASSVASLDLAAVLQASQAISGEIVLDDLLRTLMRTVLESAGAQRGFLILTGKSPLFVEAEQGAGEGAAIRVHTDAIEVRQDVAHTVVRYVERTRETVVLGDAPRAPRFQSDPYIARAAPRSVLCMPIVKQKTLVGVLYLENRIIASAFTPKRCAVLDLLSAQAAISIENARLYDTLEHRVAERTSELQAKNQELYQTVQHLKATQRQLITHEKLASLGALTAGIAHELKNPLNFVNNFAEISAELAVGVDDVLDRHAERVVPEPASEIKKILLELRQCMDCINKHGARASDIIDGMLLHARDTSGQRRSARVNALVAESVKLAYHGARGGAPEIRFEEAYDEATGEIEVNAPEMARVLINLMSNAFYAMRERQRAEGPSYVPTLSVRTRDAGDRVEIIIRDNGTGIPAEVLPRIFNPFFTTKPPGQGAGLGLSISRDIVVDGHQGDIRVDTAPGEFTAFLVTLPKQAPAA
ncbi:AAA family ATPase [Sorangium sp. So ce134]